MRGDSSAGTKVPASPAQRETRCAVMLPDRWPLLATNGSCGVATRHSLFVTRDTQV